MTYSTLHSRFREIFVLVVKSDPNTRTIFQLPSNTSQPLNKIVLISGREDDLLMENKDFDIMYQYIPKKYPNVRLEGEFFKYTKSMIRCVKIKFFSFCAMVVL